MENQAKFNTSLNEGWIVKRGNKSLDITVTPQIRDVTGQRQTYTYAPEALTY